MVFIQARNYYEQKCGRNASLMWQSKLITPPIILMHPDNNGNTEYQERK